MENTPPATPPPPAAPAAPATINYDDFAKLQLRVATVVECTAHPNADKLLVLQIDLGDERRQICAGLRQHVADPQSLVGKQIVVVANLAPRQMRGQISQGMLLAATDPASGKVIVVTPSEAVAAGSKVSYAWRSQRAIAISWMRAMMSKVKLEQLLKKRLALKRPAFELKKIGSTLAGSIISPTFRGKSDRRRQEMIRDALVAEMGPAWVKKVGMLLAYTPEEWEQPV